MPPAHLASEFAPPTFEPSVELEQWARAMFIDDGAELENEEHAHLKQAHIGWCWTNVPAKRHGRIFLGQCEMPQETAATWGKARGEHLLREWFGEIPDALITIFAPRWAEMSDREAFALSEHELLHAGQAKDQWGAPRFDSKTGAPIYAMRGHSFEEFTGVVERYGATSRELRIAAESIMAGPLFDDDQIAFACGACARA